MKIINSLKTLIIFILFFNASPIFAFENYGSGHRECSKPRFRSFSPAERKKGEPVPEVEPGSEISFTVSSNADTTTLKITAKNQILKANVVDKNSFYQVTARIPESFSGKFARINIRVKSRDKKCTSKDGFLLKVKKAAEIVEVTDPVPTEESVIKKE